MTQSQISDVSDTSIWVAYYRAQETERPDALFRDPLAKILIGERGKAIADNMKTIGKYTKTQVILRTVIIDQFIESLVNQEGVDTVINLGAGLDTRPYRLNIPASLHWIEVDYPHIISHKTNLLSAEKQRCHLTRVPLDLADLVKRKQFLSEINARAKKILVITEGVLPYLTENQVGELSADLKEQPRVVYWIAEFIDPAVYKYLQSSVRSTKMKNAPFQFFPKDWLEFFKIRGWTPKQIRYINEEAHKFGRPVPMPWWASLILYFAPHKVREKSAKVSGYVVFQKV